MFCRGHLRKCLGLGGVRFVAADAEGGCVQLGRLNRAGILDVVGQRSVASFTVDVSVPPVLLFLEDIGVAGFASLVAGKMGCPGSNFSDSFAAVVAVLSETARDQEAA